MNPLNAFTSYLRSSAEEFKKVSWPTRQEVIRYSAVVIGVSLGVAVFFAVLDIGFSKGVDLLISQRARQTTEPAPQPAPSPVPNPAQPTAPNIEFNNVQPIVTPVEEKK